MIDTTLQVPKGEEGCVDTEEAQADNDEVLDVGGPHLGGLLGLQAALAGDWRCQLF